MADAGHPVGRAEGTSSLLDDDARERAGSSQAMRPTFNHHDFFANTAPMVQRPLAQAQGELEGRRFLIVSAPFGPFSRQLAAVLRRRGATVSRMVFNAGDLLDWPRRDGIRFNERVTLWPQRLRMLAPSYTDIVVFGEGGPVNQAVITQADDLVARIWVLENGYFRPDWVTVERNGVNARSSLPRSRAGYTAPPPQIPIPTPVSRILPHHVLNISLYHLIQLPGRLLFPRYARPYTQPPWLQCAGHIRRYLGLALARRTKVQARTIAARGPFFLACLQREGDVQLLRYSRFADNTGFLAEVMRSFSRSAPADCRLVVKNHPLDPGLIDQADIVRCLAAEYGLAERVDFIDGGNLAQLCRASRGMVVNNSSAALSALGFHAPVKVLGQAFFDFEGLTDQQPLDGFWAAPQAPDAALFQRFRAHVIARTQINGNFHDPRSAVMTAEGLADAFETRADEVVLDPVDDEAVSVTARPKLRLV